MALAAAVGRPALTFTASGWLAAAALLGPLAGPLPQVLGVGAVVFAVPWWGHRRRRAKVRLQRALAAWPDISRAIGLPGSSILQKRKLYASSMVMLDSARHTVPVPVLARWLLSLGIAATLAANVAHGLGHGLIGAAVAAWPTVALVGSYVMLMMIIVSAQALGAGTVARGAPDWMAGTDPLQAKAAQTFTAELAAGCVPSVRAIHARLYVGQARAQRRACRLAM